MDAHRQTGHCKVLAFAAGILAPPLRAAPPFAGFCAVRDVEAPLRATGPALGGSVAGFGTAPLWAASLPAGAPGRGPVGGVSAPPVSAPDPLTGDSLSLHRRCVPVDIDTLR